MRADGTKAGKIIQSEEPDWAPLEAAMADILGGFMWMFEVRLSDGQRVQAYKHYLSRRYAHLGTDGRAFAYTRGGRYLLLPKPEPWGYEPAMWEVLEAARWPHREDRESVRLGDEDC